MSLLQGYHHIKIVGSDEPVIIDGPLVCEFDSTHTKAVSWHRLLAEEPCVEWRGGTICLQEIGDSYLIIK